MLFISVLLIVGAIVWAGARVAGAIAMPRPAAVDRSLDLLRFFAPAIAAPDESARVLMAWRPIADAARRLYPAEFAALDGAFGGAFPFTAERVAAVHARWTTDWLAWERRHDTEYKVKAATLEEELARTSAPSGRAQLEALEREKLDAYQRRYEEYVRVSKALQGMSGTPRT